MTETPEDPLKLKAKYKKTSIALAWNIQHLCDVYGIEKMGFLTLTFADLVLDPKEAQRRFNSLATHILKDRYLGYIRVFERQKSGRIHYHLVIAMDQDIRTGFDFNEISKGNYASANSHLRKEWAYWRSTAKKYGFGRTELLPIKSTSEGISRYVGKYIGKHFANREYQDKGLRLVSYSTGARMSTVKHSSLNKGTELWRSKLSLFAHIMGEKLDLGRPLQYEEFSFYLGKKWAFHNREFILSLPDCVMDGNSIENSIKAEIYEFVLNNFDEFRRMQVLEPSGAGDKDL